jgi:hypothetical protein
MIDIGRLPPDMNNPVALAQELARACGQKDELLESLKTCVDLLSKEINPEYWAILKARQAIERAS